MGGPMPHDIYATEEFGCGTCLYSPNCEESFIEHEQHMSSNKQKILEAILLDDLDIFSSSEDGDLVVQELGIALNGILPVHDTPTSSRNDICSREEMLHSPLDTNMLKDLSKCAAILCSEVVVQSYPLTFDADEGLSSTIVHIESLLKADSPTYACSTTPPTTPTKLVSAMKGTRRTPLETKLNVKWAPEVYDPPVTSDSHTVKGQRRHHHHHHHHSKAKKDPYKQRHSKIKSSHGTPGVDGKHAYRRSTVARS